LALLEDDYASAIRSWIDRHADELPDGFAEAVSGLARYGALYAATTALGHLAG
jgi:hypothetical protein